MTADIKARLDAAAKVSGRTQSQEAEMRIERSFDRQDLLSEVLTLAYGREAAGLLMLLGLVMIQAGEFPHIYCGAAAEGVGSWTDNPAAFANVTHAVLALLDAAKPEERSYKGPGSGLNCATELIEAIEDPNARNQFTAHSRVTATIRSLLGPIADRMIRTARTRPLVGLEPKEQARQALVSDIANVLSALVISKIRLHETGRADSPAPSRQEVFDVLEKRFPIEQQVPTGPTEDTSSDLGPLTQKADARPRRATRRSSATGEFEPVRKARVTNRKVQKP